MTVNEEAEPLLEVIDLSVTFMSSGVVTQILDNVSFQLGRHKTLGILGESGSGKTMTALSILHLITSPPLSGMSGKILFQGLDLLKCSDTDLKKIRGKHIAYIFQEPATALNPVLTIGDQIIEMIQAHKDLNKKNAKEMAIDLLTEVGISSPSLRMKNYPHEISGGMRQRAMIATALSCNPDILIAAEVVA